MKKTTEAQALKGLTAVAKYCDEHECTDCIFRRVVAWDSSCCVVTQHNPVSIDIDEIKLTEVK